VTKTTEQWKAIYKARNARRKARSTSERKADREMGRHLAKKAWDKADGTPKMPAEPRKVISDV
jgi:Spy/CpxP family protein refolding chaperone